jgi:hypothetical protein
MAVLRIIPLSYVYIGPEILGKIMVLEQELYALPVKYMQRRQKQGILLYKGIVHMDHIGGSSPAGFHDAEYFFREKGCVLDGRRRTLAAAVIAEFFQTDPGKGKVLPSFPAYDQHIIPRLSKGKGLVAQYACYPAAVQMIMN